MSRVDENDLISKFITALTIFSERSAALEAKVLSELNGMRGDIQQLKQTISSEHNTVSLPQIMEQQRMTMVEVFRQIQPIIVASQLPSLPALPTANQQPSVSLQPASIAQPIVSQQPVNLPSKPIQPTVVPKQNTSFGAEFKLKEGEWNCNGCYVKNAANTTVCPCCNTPKTGSAPQVDQKPAVSFKPQTFVPQNQAASNTLFGAGNFGAGSKSQEQPKLQEQLKLQEQPKKQEPQIPQDQSKPSPISFSFKPPAQANVSVSKSSSTTVVTPQKPAENKNLFGFGAPPVQQQPKQSLFGGGSTNNSFSNLANNSTGGASFLNSSGSNAGLFKADPKQFSFLTGVKPATSKPANANDEEGADQDETAPDEFTPDDSQFKRPDIALPDLVDVKTGEENEETVFSARCRLYRFLSGSDVKERGTGEIKLLKHKETGKLRCVMRREQVLKLCANFSIPPNFEVHTTKRGDNVLTWSCNDFSDLENPAGEPMTLICRFKDVETAAKFKTIAQATTV